MIIVDAEAMTNHGSTWTNRSAFRLLIAAFFEVNPVHNPYQKSAIKLSNVVRVAPALTPNEQRNSCRLPIDSSAPLDEVVTVLFLIEKVMVVVVVVCSRRGPAVAWFVADVPL